MKQQKLRTIIYDTLGQFSEFDALPSWLEGGRPAVAKAIAEAIAKELLEQIISEKVIRIGIQENTKPQADAKADAVERAKKNILEIFGIYGDVRDENQLDSLDHNLLDSYLVGLFDAGLETNARLKEFVDSLNSLAFEEWYGRYQSDLDATFTIFDSDGKTVASGSSAFEAWQNFVRMGMYNKRKKITKGEQ